jgi:glycosyltransferase involved in cell wall biosynthesis
MTDAMNLLVVTAAYPPMQVAEADHAYHLCQRLAQRGLRVEVLTTAGCMRQESELLNIRPVIRDWSWSDVPRFVRHLKQSSPDAVLLMYLDRAYNNHPMITFAPTIIKKLFPKALIVLQVEDRHGIRPDQCSAVTRTIRKAVALSVGLNRVNYLFGTLLQSSDRIIVLSELDRTELAKHDPSVTDKSVLIPVPPILHVRPEDNGESRLEGRRALGVDPGHFLFAYFGYAYPGKGVETLLRAFEQVAANRPESRLAMIGGGLTGSSMQRRAYLEEMRALAQQLGIDDKVRWTGEYPWDSDIGSMYLRAADACVFPMDAGVYLYNSSFAAAAVHGLPLVATQGEPREREFLHGENVLLCTPRSVDALRGAMTAVQGDSDLRRRLRAGAMRLAAECFSWEIAIDRTIVTLACSG